MKLAHYALLSLFLISTVSFANAQLTTTEIKTQINTLLETYIFNNPGNFKFITMIEQIEALIIANKQELAKEFSSKDMAEILGLLNNLKQKKISQVKELLKKYKKLLPATSLIRAKAPSWVETNFCYQFSKVG